MEEKSFNIPVNSKTISAIITLTVLISGIVGSWYVNKEKIANLESKIKSLETTKVQELKTELSLEIVRIETEAKERDNKLEQTQKENIANLNAKMDQIEDAVNGTQLSVGVIANDIKNVSANISDIKEDLKSIRTNIKRRTR